jgi:NADH:ubiquinone oxidoreductase subunit 6 (subunit J)
MAVWEQVLLGIGAVVILFLFWPGGRAAMQKSTEAENPDWQGALIPVGLVILFVILLIIIARN